jgi:ribosome-associated protein
VEGTLTIASSEHRSQLQNRRAAERRLTETLRAAIAAPPRKRRPTKPSKSAVDRRIKEKKSRGVTKRLRSSARDTE